MSMSPPLSDAGERVYAFRERWFSNNLRANPAPYRLILSWTRRNGGRWVEARSPSRAIRRNLCNAMRGVWQAEVRRFKDIMRAQHQGVVREALSPVRGS